MNPKYPIYIPSKGRWETPLTANCLMAMGVPFHLVVEDVEYRDYEAKFGAGRVLRLPFSNLGQGSIPARNWIWEHAKARGVARHWVIDDNIRKFSRFNLNRRIPVTHGTILRCAEDFTDRYENVPMSGLNYRYFVSDRSGTTPPFTLNTRIYSVILLDTSMPHRWRGRYNEDTDLSLRFLKDGYCTILFNAFIADKIGTLTMKGGNTDTVYATGDHRREFAESLQRQHPDVVEVTWRYNRWHHQVDYSPFKANKLVLKAGIVPTRRINEYGMTLRRVRRA